MTKTANSLNRISVIVSIYFMDVEEKNRQAKRYSGGIIIFVNNSLKKFVTMEQSTDEDIIWLKVNKSLTYSPQDLYLGCTYISPIMSC